MTSQPPHVLIVDDETNIAVSLVSLTKQQDYQTTSAGDGKTALVEVERFSPDPVLLDITLPELDPTSRSSW